MTHAQMIAELQTERARLERVRDEIKSERERIQALVMMLTNLEKAS